MTTSSKSQVTLQDVGHHFLESPWLFRGLSFSFLPGTVYALTGPSGSGKSTLLSIIAGWVEPSEGTVDRQGEHDIRWVFQNPHGVRNRTAVDHVALPLIARGAARAEAEEIAMNHLAQVSLTHVARRPFNQLSGGEAQRLMLARGIASQPEVLLVDEPTAQLDLATGDTVNRALSTVSAGLTTIIVATHDTRTVEACDEVLSLEMFSPPNNNSEDLR